MCEDREELREEVAVTVVHEIAHFFGIAEAAPPRPRLGLGAPEAASDSGRALCFCHCAQEYCQTPMPSVGLKTRLEPTNFTTSPTLDWLYIHSAFDGERLVQPCETLA